MLGYLVKGNKPEWLKEFPLSKIGTNGNGTIYHLSTYEGKQVLMPKPEDLFPTNDPNVSAFKISEEIDPAKHLKKQPILYGSLESAVELADGKRYVIPKLRICPTLEHELESRYFKDSKGERLEVIAKHKAAYELGEVIFKCLTTANVPEGFDPVLALATLLGVNYYITEYEVSAYGLFSKNNFWNIVGPHVIDLKTWVDYVESTEEVKKN